jgi:hypothetical protein
MKQDVVPAGATIDELRQKATSCEEQAAEAAEPRASALREEAKLYRKWIALWRTGAWTS